jgi:endonuclease/exonuclease/phosphatase family metal-dependent hydrolase
MTPREVTRMPDHFLAFWNVENLFGPEHHPPRIPWVADRVAADLRGWTPALYARKVAQLARVIAGMNDGAGPDVLGLCEVEDAFVLGDLADAVNEALPDRAYLPLHVDSPGEARGVDTAFLYDANRYGVDPAAIFSHFVLRRTGTRDILQATFRTAAGNDLVVLANHWPSRRGGDVAASAGFRATAGETLGYWHQRIREVKGDRAAVVAMGDFNDDPWDASLRHHALAWREAGDVARARSARFLNLAWGFLRTDAVDRAGTPRVLDGTLYFDDNGNLFDQILISPPVVDGRGPFRLKPGSARMVCPPDMVSTRVGEGPVPFGLPKGDAARFANPDGYSDHFPVSVVLTEGP